MGITPKKDGGDRKRRGKTGTGMACMPLQADASMLPAGAAKWAVCAACEKIRYQCVVLMFWRTHCYSTLLMRAVLVTNARAVSWMDVEFSFSLFWCIYVSK
jgi:hypothetical protein